MDTRLGKLGNHLLSVHRVRLVQPPRRQEIVEWDFDLTTGVIQVVANCLGGGGCKHSDLSCSFGYGWSLVRASVPLRALPWAAVSKLARVCVYVNNFM